MPKQALLVAKTFLAYGGRQYGQNMQFHADPKDAEVLVASGQAAEVTADDKKAIREAEKADAPLLAPSK